MTCSLLIQAAADKFSQIRKRLLQHLVILSFRCYGLTASKDEIVNEFYGDSRREDIRLDSADLDGFLDATKCVYEQSKERIQNVAEKCQTLLRTASFMMAAFGVLFPKFLAFDSWISKLWFAALVLMLLNSVTLLLVFFGVRRGVFFEFGQHEASLSTDDLKKSLINDYRYVTKCLDCRNDYLVDLYSVSRFYFLASFTMCVGLFLTTFFLPRGQDETGKLIQALSSQISFVKGADGERGAKGDRGDKGDKGGKGERGEQGPKGDSAVFDHDAVVSRIINDPRFREVLKDMFNENSKREPNQTPHTKNEPK